MYEYIEGQLVYCQQQHAVLDVGGLGYRIRVPSSTVRVIEGKSVVKLYVELKTRDDHMELFGFASLEEREVFNGICRVSGIGPSTALVILSHSPLDEFRTAILAGESQGLQKIKGIGRKTADRLILELREAFKESSFTPANTVKPKSHQAEEDAVGALVALGYSPVEAKSAIQKAIEFLPEDKSADTSASELVRLATRPARGIAKAK